MSTLAGRAVAQDVEADTVTSEAEPRVLLSEAVYASPVAAHQEIQTRAFAEIRRYGYTGPFEGVIWRLHLI